MTEEIKKDEYELRSFWVFNFDTNKEGTKLFPTEVGTNEFVVSFNYNGRWWEKMIPIEDVLRSLVEKEIEVIKERLKIQSVNGL